jgi:hypothetical protein
MDTMMARDVHRVYHQTRRPFFMSAQPIRHTTPSSPNLAISPPGDRLNDQDRQSESAVAKKLAGDRAPVVLLEPHWWDAIENATD